MNSVQTNCANKELTRYIKLFDDNVLFEDSDVRAPQLLEAAPVATLVKAPAEKSSGKAFAPSFFAAGNSFGSEPKIKPLMARRRSRHARRRPFVVRYASAH